MISVAKQLGIQVCLLLIEVYISTYELSKASEHIELFERRLFGGSLNNGGGKGDKDDSKGAETDKYKPHIYQVIFNGFILNPFI